MDKYLTKLVAAGKTHPDVIKSNKENNNSEVEILEDKKQVKKVESKNCKVILTRLNSKEKANDTDSKMEVDVIEQTTPEVKLDEETSGDETSAENVARKVYNRAAASKDPSTPVGNTSRPAMSSSLSSTKKKKTDAEKQLANQIRLENLKKKEEEEQKRKEARLKQEEERRKLKAEAEERKAERLKLEEEKRKRRAEEEERKAENRRKMEELRQKREEEKLKREEEKIKQMEEKLEKEKDLEKQRLEKLEKERLKNEEKRLKEEEKAKEEEEKRRKADLVKNKFAQFFVKVDVPKSAETDKENQKMGRFMSFQLKANMTQAPIVRRSDIQDFDEFRQKMDEILKKCSEDNSKPSYLKEIRENPKLIRRVKTNCRKSCKSKLIKIIDPEEESVMSVEEMKSSLDTEIIPEVEQVKTRVKYIHFDKTECNRPPYYGTWRKKSRKIRPRNPFAMDEKLIDYEVDSADEWEDIVDAESIGDSDKDEEEERMKDAEDEDDDGFLVPHGHLSDDELEEDERMMNPEQRKLREAAKTEQWETERKKATKHIIPKCYFTEDYWNGRDPSLDTAKHARHLNHLERLQMMPFMQDLSPSLFPMHIVTDQQIEHEKQVKQANDEAVKKAKAVAAAAAKEALKEDAASNGSPTTTPKTKLKKKNSDNGQNNSPLVANGTNTPVAAGSSSILKFVSKMSNKNILVKPANAQETDTEKSEIVMIPKPPLPMNKATSSPMGNQKSGTPISKRRSLLTGSPALQTTPQSPAEKRANDFSGENVVKRMKLNDEANPEGGVNTPTIKSLFKNSPGRKNLNSSMTNSPLQSPAVKKHVLGPAKRNSIDGIASRLLADASMKTETPTTTSESSNSQMETESSVVVNDKENSCITLE